MVSPAPVDAAASRVDAEVGRRRHRRITGPSGLLLFVCLFLPAVKGCGEPVYPITMPCSWHPYLYGIVLRGRCASTLTRRAACGARSCVLRVLAWLTIAGACVLADRELRASAFIELGLGLVLLARDRRARATRRRARRDHGHRRRRRHRSCGSGCGPASPDALVGVYLSTLAAVDLLARWPRSGSAETYDSRHGWSSRVCVWLVARCSRSQPVVIRARRRPTRKARGPRASRRSTRAAVRACTARTTCVASTTCAVAARARTSATTTPRSARSSARAARSTRAIDSYNKALGHYDSEKIALPPDVDCAYGATLAAAQGQEGACRARRPRAAPLHPRRAGRQLASRCARSPSSRTHRRGPRSARARPHPARRRLPDARAAGAGDRQARTSRSTANPPVDKKTFRR